MKLLLRRVSAGFLYQSVYIVIFTYSIYRSVPLIEFIRICAKIDEKIFWFIIYLFIFRKGISFHFCHKNIMDTCGISYAIIIISHLGWIKSTVLYYLSIRRLLLHGA